MAARCGAFPVRDLLAAGILLAVCLLLLPFESRGQFQQHPVDRIGVDKGLPFQNVYDLIQDRKGYLWLVGVGGMAKYDGYAFQPFHPNIYDSTALWSRIVFSAMEDRAGRFWLTTNNGLHRFDPGAGSFQRFFHDPDDPASIAGNYSYSTAEDAHGRIWVAVSQGVDAFDPATGSFTHFSDPQDKRKRNFELNQDRKGQLLVYSNDGLWRIDTLAGVLQPIGVPAALLQRMRSIGDLVWEDDDNLIVVTYGGLFRYRITTETWEEVALPDEVRQAGWINSLLIDSKSNWWIGTISQGLFKWRADEELIHYRNEKGNMHSLSGNRIIRLLEDAFGNIWVSTNAGLNRIYRDGEPFVWYKISDDPSWIDQGVVQLIEDCEEHLWVKLSNEAYFFYLPGPGEEPVHASQLAGFSGQDLKRSILCAWSDCFAGRVWFGTYGDGLLYFDLAARQFQRFPGSDSLNNAIITEICGDATHPELLWLSSLNYGLGTLDVRTGESRWFSPKASFPDLSSHSVRNAQPAAGGDYIMGSLGGGGFFRWEIRTGRWERLANANRSAPVLGGPYVTDMAEFPKGQWWLGTFSLDVVETADWKVAARFSDRDGLPPGQVQTILPDPEHDDLWLSFQNHLVRFDLQDSTFTTFDFSDKISYEFMSGVRMRRKSGEFVFGSNQGFYGFYPERLKLEQTPPRVMLKDVRVFNQPFSADRPPDELEKLTFRFREKVITFEFVALHFRSPELNEYAYRLEGFDPEWTVGRNLRQATYTNLDPGEYTFRVKAANPDGFWNEEGLALKVVILAPFWMQLWFRLVAALVILGIAFAVLRNWMAGRTLRHQKELAEKNSRYKSMFLANVSHEIRTPMNAIIGLNNLLLDTPLNAKQREYAETIRQSSENLLWIINDVLDQAKIESGKFTFTEKAFELPLILQQLYHSFIHKAREKQLDFKVEVEETVPAFLIGDPIRLYQILMNLVGNALKFTDEGEVVVAVTAVAVEADRCRLRFSVRDTGPGIPEDQQGLIFESFHQLSGKMETGLQGTGLGLSIAQQLVEQQDGTIGVRSREGAGARFFFELPFGRAAGPKIAGRERQEAWQLSDLTVLLAEDAYFNQMLAVELLRKHIPGVTIVVAENGQVAIEQLRQKDFDLILMDLKMPVMDGYEATRIIRQLPDPVKRAVPIIALTANAIPEQLEACREAGMQDWVTKPIDADQLLRKMHYWKDKHDPTKQK